MSFVFVEYVCRERGRPFNGVHGITVSFKDCWGYGCHTCVDVSSMRRQVFSIYTHIYIYTCV